MSKPNYKPIGCKFCGEIFKPKTGNQLYCSENCKKERERLHRKSKYDYVKTGVTREMTCKICGNTYVGHFNSKYCISCLKESKYSIRRYLYNRVDYEEEEEDEDVI